MQNYTTSNEDISYLANQAISAASILDWDTAIKINKKILTVSKDNVEALNRLARAQSCVGKFEKAKKLYRKVLELDPYNIIAKKNLEKISKFSVSGNGHTIGNGHTNGNAHLNLATLFIYEPGKTKLINLLNLAPPSILATLNCGDKVYLNPKSHSVSITTDNKTYLGALPDDLAHRLIAFISGGNEYEAYIKSASSKALTIFIREARRALKFASQPSFQNTNSSDFDEQSYIY